MARASRMVKGFPVVLALSIACTRGTDSPSAWSLRDGGTLGSIYGEDDSGVVLVLDPRGMGKKCVNVGGRDLLSGDDCVVDAE